MLYWLAGYSDGGDVFNLFVFLEISSLSSYALISMGRDRRALTAAYQYLIMGTIGASFLLIGIGLLYAETGTLNMMDLQQRLPAQFEQRTLQTGFAFIVVGIALKLAMLPLHLWLPNAYTYAPSVVTIFLAATATKVAVYVMIRFLFTVFGAEFVFSDMHLDYLLLPLAAIAILSASLVAIFQENTKRMLAYSSVAQIGYLLLGLGMATTAGLNATLVHLFNHAIMKAALFMSLGAIAYRIGSTQLADLAGLGKQMPLTMAAFVIGGLSLVGVPLTAGFFSKWVLIEAAMEKYQWWLVIVIVVGSLLTLVYIWRVVETIYLKPSSQPHTHAEAPASLLIPMGILLLVNIYMGVQAGTGGAYTLSAAQQILGVLP